MTSNNALFKYHIMNVSTLLRINRLDAIMYYFNLNQRLEDKYI